MDVENRIGRFALPEGILDDFATDDGVANAVGSLFSKIFIIRCEHIFANDSFDYVGWSKMFRIVEKDESVPIYKLRYNNEIHDLECEEIQRAEIKEVKEN